MRTVSILLVALFAMSAVNAAYTKVSDTSSAPQTCTSGKVLTITTKCGNCAKYYTTQYVDGTKFKYTATCSSCSSGTATEITTFEGTAAEAITKGLESLTKDTTMDISGACFAAIKAFSVLGAVAMLLWA